MDKELKKGIKQLLFLDSLISSTGSLSEILDEVEDELEEIFGEPHKKINSKEDFYKIRTIK